ncbi:hypothetical protein [Delftia sp. GW456-R20]|uniref:hypothetical protein n=1 Tax=Delftia sp. GW456-R20 TaxID=1827145 RepID=UPI001E5CA56E|nr:hypothetical protein [Delftia sp. GW456-R20]
MGYNKMGQNARRSLGHVGYARRAHHENAAGDAQVTAKAGASVTGLRSHPSLPLRPSGHAHGPDRPARVSGLGRTVGPLWQCAAGIQPTGDVSQRFEVWSGEEGLLHKAHHLSQEIVQPGDNSDLGKITEQAWKDFKGNEINAFKITCGCDWTDFLSCITHAGFRFCNRCGVVLFLGNIFRIFGLHCWIYIFAFNKESNICINLDNKHIFLCLL